MMGFTGDTVLLAPSKLDIKPVAGSICRNLSHSKLSVLADVLDHSGVKQSGIGRELGEYALTAYTNAKAVHVNLGTRL
ncbi:hypothetical protein L873DRAFT_1809942 [Choiromyces venosus 120613-1]|uniref:Aldehyde dehydrogenase domain-containing protein n=1 Tax=Choiromyces venosus 120613-1 TaxID=1336337 RepID=A0A3N4JGK0_9PEZI|nr:hypothetical protein L873DRAFT_1809942 [Choiromyces venosus 120613-1]